MPYQLKSGLTVADAQGVAKTNVSAFWTQTWWRILFDASEQEVVNKVASRTPQNLLAQRLVRRHQAVVDTTTGDIVGYARWILPEEHADDWLEAQTPAVSDAERTRFKEMFDAEQLPMGENQDEMDALDDPVHEKQDELEPKTPNLSMWSTKFLLSSIAHPFCSEDLEET